MLQKSGSTTVKNSARVLVVDDEKVLAYSLGLLLTQNGYDVATHTNPLAALDAFRERPFDLVISDVMMPGMSGIDLAVQLEEHSPGCKILLISGQANTPQLVATMKERSVDFDVFPKPFSPDELLQRVKVSVTAND